MRRWGGPEPWVCKCACECVCDGQSGRLRVREVREELCGPHLLPTPLSFQLQPEPPVLAAAALQFSGT